MTGPSAETDRDLYWRKKLRRLRFGVEPFAVQLEKYRLVTLALSAVSAVVAALFLMIFAAFRRPDIGLIVDGLLIAPIVAIAWGDYRVLAGRVAAYEAERDGPAPVAAAGPPGDGRSP